MLWCFGGSWVCFMLQTLLDVFFGLDSKIWIYCSLRYTLWLFLAAVQDAWIVPGSTLDRPWFDPESTLGERADPGSTQGRPHVDP